MSAPLHPTPCDPMDCMQPARFLCPWDFLGMNTGEGCHALLQGIFLTQGPSPYLLHHLHWQVGSLTPAPPGKSWYCSIHYCIKRKEKRKSSLYATYIPVVSQCGCKCGRTISTHLVEHCTAVFSRSLCKFIINSCFFNSHENK